MRAAKLSRILRKLQDADTTRVQHFSNPINGSPHCNQVLVNAVTGEATTIEQAKTEFLADSEARKLKDSTLDRYRIIFPQLEAFASIKGIRFLKELDTPTLNQFRASWKGESGLADLKKLERLRSFFKFAMASGYTEQNPAAAIRNPKIRPNPTLPFSQEEMLAIFTAASKRLTDADQQGRTVRAS